MASFAKYLIPLSIALVSACDFSDKEIQQKLQGRWGLKESEQKSFNPGSFYNPAIYADYLLFSSDSLYLFCGTGMSYFENVPFQLKNDSLRFIYNEQEKIYPFKNAPSGSFLPECGLAVEFQTDSTLTIREQNCFEILETTYSIVRDSIVYKMGTRYYRGRFYFEDNSLWLSWQDKAITNKQRFVKYPEDITMLAEDVFSTS